MTRMGRATLVPITPSVLEWAIDESGMRADQVAKRLGVAPDELEAWLRGAAQPSLTAFKKLAEVLRRPTATFLLPRPPATKALQLEFRHPPGVQDRELLPEERLRIREVARLQDGVAWLLDEMGDVTPELPRFTLGQSAEQAGKRIRELLSVSEDQQARWQDTDAALKGWRHSLEDLGVLVFLLPMGAESARGFSIWKPRAPAIVANTHWNSAARLFTLFHEMAHLLTRTSSVCVEDGRRSAGENTVERWCEQAAAAALMPEASVRTFVEDVVDAATVRCAQALAARYRVSLRAAAVRLITLGFAEWSLYSALPPLSDGKRAGGGGRGRNRPQKRLDEYGRRTTGTFVQAAQREVIAAADVMRYLDITNQNLVDLEKKLAA